jgi:hypothetical protein
VVHQDDNLDRRPEAENVPTERGTPNLNLHLPESSLVPELVPSDSDLRRRGFPRWPGRRHKNVSGEVIAVEATHMEPPGFNIFYFLTRLCWGIIFIGIPFLILRTLWAALGGLAVILSIVILYYSLRNLNPLNLLALVHLLGFFNPFHRREDQLPVRYYRLRTEEGNEHVIRLKGHYKAGNCSLGDMVTFWGRWRNGTFFARKGYNERTASKILVRRDYSILAFSLTIAFTIMVVITCISYYLPTQKVVKDRLSGVEKLNSGIERLNYGK